MVKINYKPGDKVFAKVKGYPPWPAEVVSEVGKKYNVLFYGTKEVGAIKPEDMFFYLKHKDRYIHKYVKRAGYEDAVKQIEEAISKNGGDGDSFDGETNDTISELDDTETSTPSMVVKRKYTSLPMPVVAKKSIGKGRRSVSTSESGGVAEEPATKRARRKSVLSSEASEEKVALSENVSENTEEILESGKDSIKDDTIETDLVSNNTMTDENEAIIISVEGDTGDEIREEANTTPEAVPVKQNEEKEPKKYPSKAVQKNVNQQLISVKVVTEQTLNQYIKYAEHVRKNPDLFNGPVEARTASENDVLPVKLPVGTIAGIKLYKKWPIEHDTERERAFYDEKVAKDALDAKKLLSEGSETDLEVIPDIGKTADDIKELTYTEDIEVKRNRVKRLRKEVEVLGWDVKMKNSLGLDKADPEAALALLKEFNDLKQYIDSLILKKHPHVLDTIRRLRKYIGNVKEWIMTQEDQQVFMRKAEKIRSLAEEMYVSLKALFKVDEEKVTFWEGFMDQVTEFRTKCQDLSENELLLLCSEPGTRKAFLDQLNEVPGIESVCAGDAPGAAALDRS